jgi:Na+/phosphate symporter
MTISFGYWLFALGFIALGLFAIPEYIAIRTHSKTFSEFMAHMARDSKFAPIWNFAWGLLVGGLAVHFSGWCIGPCIDLPK